MEKRVKYTLDAAKALAAVACLSLAAYAASAPAKSPASGAAATQDTAKAKSPSGSATVPAGTAAGTGSPAATPPGTASGSAAATGAASTGAAGSASAGTQPAGALTDGEILGLVNTVDEHEVDAANKALKEKMGKEASEYAKMLRDAHKANQARNKQVAKAANAKIRTNKTADSLKAAGKAEVKAMAAKDGQEFEKAYIDAMVKGHTDVLAMLDAKLIPAAQHDSVKSHLNTVRGHVSHHLEQGKRLQGASAAAPAP